MGQLSIHSLNFFALMTNEKADAIIKAMDSLAYTVPDYPRHYRVNGATAKLKPSKRKMEIPQE